MSRDTYDGTLDNPITQNHYAYGNVNPTYYVDPSGHMGMVDLTMSMSVMTELRAINPGAALAMRKMIQEAGCVVVKEGIEYTIKEGIYMWITHDGKVYVGKSNDDIERRIKDHVNKKSKIFNKQLARVGLSLPPQLLEAIEQVIMTYMGFEEENHGDSANKRRNYGDKRAKAFRRYKRLLDKLCK